MGGIHGVHPSLCVWSSFKYGSPLPALHDHNVPCLSSHVTRAAHELFVYPPEHQILYMLDSDERLSVDGMVHCR